MRPQESRVEIIIPEEVSDYLKYFKQCVINKNVPEIYSLYEYGFNDLTDRYYKEKHYWPDFDHVEPIVGEDCKIFSILYKELYYRYIYARITRGPTLEPRFNSYQNYNDLFAYILDSTEPVPLFLPDRWIWDIIDEFVYQFQSFCQYKANPAKISDLDLPDLVNMERDVWNLYPVLNILYSVVAKSQINEQLRALNNGENPDDVADEFGRHPLYFKLGYFSLIGLLRLHILIGDYSEALRTVQHLEFDPKGLYNTVPSCLVTLHYFVAFAHMMMRNYQEAIKIFVNCLLFIQRSRNLQQQQQQKTWQYDVEPTNQQMRIFMTEIREQQLIPVLRGYLKLYSSIPLNKLASFMELSQEDLVSALFSFKHKLCDTTKFMAETEEDTTADLDFYIDKEMIYIADTKVGRRYGEYFIRHIQKLMEPKPDVKNFNPDDGFGAFGLSHIQQLD